MSYQGTMYSKIIYFLETTQGAGSVLAQVFELDLTKLNLIKDSTAFFYFKIFTKG
jgi:hypothetical protein